MTAIKLKTITRPILRQPPETGRAATKISISLDTAGGIFHLRLPARIIAILGCANTMSAISLKRLTDDLDARIEAYEIAARLTIATRVIVINYRTKYDDPSIPSGFQSDFTESGTDHLPRQIIGFDHEVLLKIGGHLYRQEFEGAPLEHRGPAKSSRTHIVMDWSQHAEDMLAEMTDRLGSMIARMNAFFAHDTAADNIARAIGTNSRTLLGSPDESGAAT